MQNPASESRWPPRSATSEFLLRTIGVEPAALLQRWREAGKVLCRKEAYRAGSRNARYLSRRRFPASLSQEWRPTSGKQPGWSAESKENRPAPSVVQGPQERRAAMDP